MITRECKRIEIWATDESEGLRDERHVLKAYACVALV